MPAQTVEAPARAMHRYQLDNGFGRLTPAERVVRGKAARAEVPRDSHAVFDPPSDRADPIALLEEQARSRVPELVPVRWDRMLVSPFTYYRGAALPMASDLATTPVSGIAVQACGDAHLSNFGLFGSAERRLMAKLTRMVDGRPRIISDPPLLVPIDELLPAERDRDGLEESSASAASERAAGSS
jgi:hypothetical protein